MILPTWLFKIGEITVGCAVISLGFFSLPWLYGKGVPSNLTIMWFGILFGYIFGRLYEFHCMKLWIKTMESSDE